MVEILNTIPGFEGPEKRLEVVFKASTSTSCSPKFLRNFGKEEWQNILNPAKCTIISQTSNEFIDAYVLSESSLFVYEKSIMVKTCGTTTLLKILPGLMELAASVNLVIEYLCYSRRSFNFPSRQLYPHTSFEHETNYLSSIFPDGHSYVFGALKGENWNLFLVDKRESNAEKIFTLEIMMSELDRDVMKLFYKTDRDAKEITQLSGIGNLIPGSINDEVLFDPCGYSLNGINKDALYTIHITPEPGFSYVSFETNLKLSDYTALVHDVINVFKPGKFSVALYGNIFTGITFKPLIHSFDLKCKTKQTLIGNKANFYNYIVDEENEQHSNMLSSLVHLAA